MKLRRIRPSICLIAILIGATTVCTDTSGPERGAGLVNRPDDWETVIGPAGTNGEWWVRGRLVVDTIPQDHPSHGALPNMRLKLPAPTSKGIHLFVNDKAPRRSLGASR